MKTFNISEIHKQADSRLAGASYNPKKLALIYAGAALGISVLITLVDLFLLRGIGTTSGLSGLGMRSVLETIREVMQTALSFALPFWEFGFIFTALAMARGGDNRPAGLLEGFRRFGPVLRLRLQRGLLFIGIALVCVYAGAFLYYASPLATELVALMEPILLEATTVEEIEAALAQIPGDQLLGYVWPALAFGGALCALVLLPLHYRFRMADFFVMDEPKMLPMVAMITSSRCMRKNRMQWFRLDLSFWWYYLGLGLSVAACYGDMILPRLGVQLPMQSDDAWLLFYLLGSVLLFVVEWFGRSKVQTACALAYDVLRQQAPVFPTEPPKPEKQPWDPYPTEE